MFCKGTEKMAKTQKNVLFLSFSFVNQKNIVPLQPISVFASARPYFDL